MADRFDEMAAKIFPPEPRNPQLGGRFVRDDISAALRAADAAGYERAKEAAAQCAEKFAKQNTDGSRREHQTAAKLRKLGDPLLMADSHSACAAELDAIALDCLCIADDIRALTPTQES